MVLVTTQQELLSQLIPRQKNQKIGFVPTMGALHAGHLSLVSRAISENQKVVVSIFVNPTQFDNKEDLKKYPKTLEADINILSTISKDLVIFAPSVKDMYTKTVATKSYQFNGLDKVMEGAFRDDHFNGVGTIVEALLNLVQPDRAYFGEKDFQQLQIIKKMVELHKIPVEIIGCPIVRESSGLAMSSRNERLSKLVRKEASFIYKILEQAKVKFGTNSAKYVKDWVTAQFQTNAYLKLEYFEIADVRTLKSIDKKIKNKKYRAFIAVYADGIRLIDNIALN